MGNLPTYTLNHSIFPVQEQQDFYEESRRKVVHGATAQVEVVIERQRVELFIISLCELLDLLVEQIATDASELIRHYNALLRPTTSK